MNLLLTDRLTCPRCGPAFGLILLAHEVRDRRVLRGELGCVNCRDRFPVEGGFGDLRAPPRGPLAAPGPGLPEGEAGPGEALRLATLLGVARGPGTLLIRGPAARYAAAVAGLVPEVEVVALDPSVKGEGERPGVSRMVARPGFPFYSGTFRGVLLSGEGASAVVPEATRVTAPPGRVVVLGAAAGVREALEASGWEILLDGEGDLVARRPPGRARKTPG